MKKIIVMLLITCMSVAMFTGCGGDAGNAESAVVKQSDEDVAKEAYAELGSTADVVSALGHGIAGAWGYAIDADLYSGYAGLASACGLDVEDIRAAYNEYIDAVLGGDDFFRDKESVMVGDFNTVIEVLVNYAYADIIASVDSDLSSTKAKIQSMDKENEYYSSLVDYYTAVSNYLDFVKSPSGSYSTISETLQDYEENIDSLKSKLSFYLE